MALMQLAYISRATFDQYAQNLGIEPTIARILATSRRNNPVQGIVGGLYYGDGCFFQYLEGEEAAVKALCERIRKDKRHTDFKIVLEGAIDALSFGNWSMKYVPVTVGIDAFLYRHKLNAFDPYRFTPDMVQEVIELIHVAQGSEKVTVAGTKRKTFRASGMGVALGSAGVALAAALVASIYILL